MEKKKKNKQPSDDCKLFGCIRSDKNCEKCNMSSKEKASKEKYKYDIDGILKDILSKKELKKPASLEDRIKELEFILINTTVVNNALIETLMMHGCLNPIELQVMIRRNFEILERMRRERGQNG